MVTLTPEQQEVFTYHLNFFIKLINDKEIKLTEEEQVLTAFRNFAQGTILPEEEKYILLFFDFCYSLFAVPFKGNKFIDKANSHRQMYILYPILEWVMEKHGACAQ